MKRVTNLRKDVSLPMPDGSGLAPGASTKVEDSVAYSDRLAQWEKAKAISVEDVESADPGDVLHPDSDPAPLTPVEDKPAQEPRRRGKAKGRHVTPKPAPTEEVQEGSPLGGLEPAIDIDASQG